MFGMFTVCLCWKVTRVRGKSALNVSVLRIWFNLNLQEKLNRCTGSTLYRRECVVQLIQNLIFSLKISLFKKKNIMSHILGIFFLCYFVECFESQGHCIIQLTKLNKSQYFIIMFLFIIFLFLLFNLYFLVFLFSPIYSTRFLFSGQLE